MFSLYYDSFCEISLSTCEHNYLCNCRTLNNVCIKPIQKPWIFKRRLAKVWRQCVSTHVLYLEALISQSSIL